MAHASFEPSLRAAPRKIDRLLAPVRGFLEHRLAGAILLLVMTAAALFLANSKFHEAYHHTLETQVSLGFGRFRLAQSVHHFVNDGLMSIFFFSVGLEIKRELMVGELSSFKKAILPAIAAIGGMILPALVFHQLNPAGAEAAGWGIPMATDIAFALGVLAVLGSRVPVGLKVFLTALAIVDDIGAVLVIALFYTSHVDMTLLAIGGGCFLVALALNFLEVRHSLPYLMVGIVMWVLFLYSGVHATISAILMAFAIPSTTRIDGEALLESMAELARALRSVGVPKEARMNTSEQQSILMAMEQKIEQSSAPLQNIETYLHGPVAFVILPIFALANAGVTLEGDVMAALGSPVAIGVVAGLFLGKQLGISLFTWVTVRLRIAELPEGVGWLALHGVSILGGIGFTMSLFVAALAYGSPELLADAKVGILVGSVLSAVIGLVFLGFGLSRGREEPAETSDGEAATDLAS